MWRTRLPALRRHIVARRRLRHARELWGDLTDDDFDKMAGQREQFIGPVQERHRETRDIAEREVDDFVAALKEPAYR
jgi:uncharacterized protein YjbJ (UPF0337 family)